MRSLAFALLVACTAAACRQAPSSTVPGGGLAARESLEWDQHAWDADELARYTYVAYVDGIANLLVTASCGEPNPDSLTATCSAPVPAMQPGQHTLELATRLAIDGTVLESERSAPLSVTIAGSNLSPVPVVSISGNNHGNDASSRERRQMQSADVKVDLVATGLDQPLSFARLPDGRFLVSERGGRIRLVEGGTVADTPAAVLHDLAVVQGADSVSLAVSPDFATSRFVYVSYLARSGGDDQGATAQVVRFREVGGVLGERAVIVADLPGQYPAPRVRVGPDGRLYVGTAGTNVGVSDSASLYSGKILRFTKSGATPGDNPLGYSPVFAGGYEGRVDFDWDRAAGVLWSVETTDDRTSVSRATNNTTEHADPLLSLTFHASDVAFHSGSTPAAWEGNLFLVSRDEGVLYRISGLASASSPTTRPTTTRLFAERFGRIVAVASADDGLYFATGNGVDAAGRPSDTIYRVRDR